MSDRKTVNDVLTSDSRGVANVDSAKVIMPPEKPQ